VAESLATLDGELVDLDATEAAFAAAMAAPATDKPGMPAPARRPPEPEPDAENAPHGWTWDSDAGEWRAKKSPGRPRSAADKARVTTAPSPSRPAAAAAPSTAPPPATPKQGRLDYRRVVRDTAEAAWFVLATVPVPEQAFGYKLGGLRVKVRAQAALLEQHLDGVAGGVATIAAHNSMLARALARMDAGEGGLWVLPAVMMLAPFVAATGQLWAGKLDDGELVDELAAHTEAAAQAYLSALAGVPAAA